MYRGVRFFNIIILKDCARLDLELFCKIVRTLLANSSGSNGHCIPLLVNSNGIVFPWLPSLSLQACLCESA